jgi:hypothetical protein
VVSVRRNVHTRPRPLRLVLGRTAPTRSGDVNALTSSKDWARVAPDGLVPKYSDAFRKRLDLPPGVQPLTSGAASSLSSSSALTLVESESWGEFKSLTDAMWGEFENVGFGGLESSDRKLQFDLTECARAGVGFSFVFFLLDLLFCRTLPFRHGLEH